MTITAKFPGVCTVCQGKIRAGDQIEWAKGAGSKHAACAAGKPAAASQAAPKPRKSSAPRARREPPAGPMMRNDRAPYERGEVLTCQLTTAEVAECETRQSLTATDVPGDKPERAGRRRVAVVVIHTDRMSQENADDNGYMGRYGCVVRLATAEEAAPLVETRAAKAQAKANAEAAAKAWSAQLATLTAGRILVEGGSIDRAGAEILHEERKGLHGTVSARWSRLADGSIAQETYAYDDERWGRWVTVEQLLDFARVSGRSLEDAIRGQRYSAIDRAIVWLAAQAGKTPRAPVTVTLCGLSTPVTLEVRISSASGLVVAEPVGGAAIRIPEGNSVRISSGWSWPVDRLRAQLDAAAPASAFTDLEFAPGAEIGGDCLPLPGGLWIEGMRAALAELEAR
jgi:hypothetical protein